MLPRGLSAGQSGVAPIRVVEGIAVTTLCHDERHLLDSLNVGRERDGGLRPSHETTRGQLRAVTPDLEHDRSSVTDLLIESDVGEEGRTRAVELDEDLRGSVRPDPVVERSRADPQRVPVVGAPFAVASVDFRRSPSVVRVEPREIAREGDRSLEGRRRRRRRRRDLVRPEIGRASCRERV